MQTFLQSAVTGGPGLVLNALENRSQRQARRQAEQSAPDAYAVEALDPAHAQWIVPNTAPADQAGRTDFLSRAMAELDEIRRQNERRLQARQVRPQEGGSPDPSGSIAEKPPAEKARSPVTVPETANSASDSLRNVSETGENGSVNPLEAIVAAGGIRPDVLKNDLGWTDEAIRRLPEGLVAENGKTLPPVQRALKRAGLAADVRAILENASGPAIAETGFAQAEAGLSSGPEARGAQPLTEPFVAQGPEKPGDEDVRNRVSFPGTDGRKAPAGFGNDSSSGTGRGLEFSPETGRFQPAGAGRDTAGGPEKQAVRETRLAGPESVSAAERGEADGQFDDVVAKYRGTENWMKAPNGQPTKLTERQWAQVRTGNFKRWFGFDWELQHEGIGGQSGYADTGTPGQSLHEIPDIGEKILEAESRRDYGRARSLREEIGQRLGAAGLLDPETGEPRVFYHGTKDSFDAFDLNHPNRKDAGNLGDGIYLAVDPYEAASFGNGKRGENGQNVMPLFVRMRKPFIEDAANKASNLSKEQARQRTEALKAQGYDGIIAYNFNQSDWQENPMMVVVFSPEQVKSAVGNTGAFSERPDLLYSRAAKDAFRPGHDGVSSAAAGPANAPAASGFPEKADNSPDAPAAAPLSSGDAAAETGGSEKADPFYSFAGKKGVSNLDAADESAARMDNLAIAQQMEAKGAIPDAINFATGWERGADGKWRFELDDSQSGFDPAGQFGYRRERAAFEERVRKLGETAPDVLARFRELDARRKKRDKTGRTTGDDLTAAERKEWKRLEDRYGLKRPRPEANPAELPAFLDHPELYRAYPELADVALSFDSRMQAKGMAIPDWKLIVLKKGLSPEESKRALIHEVQHMIQAIEGFSPAGAPGEKTAKAYAESLRDEVRDWPSFGKLKTEEERQAYLRQYAESRAPSGSAALEGYRRLAGEVEARNAAKRQDRGAAYRRMTPPYMTEDIGRKHQIVPEDGPENGDGFALETGFGQTAGAVRLALAKDPVNRIAQVVQSVEALPEPLQERVKNGGAETGVEGIYDPEENRVYLIADNLSSPERAREVARHEVIGHYGMENMLGRERMDAAVKRVQDALRHGNKTVCELSKEVRRNQPGLSERAHAREIISLMAERNMQNGLVRRILEAIRVFLKKIGVIAEATDAEIAAMLRDARRYLMEKAERWGGSGPAPSVPPGSRFTREAGYRGTGPDAEGAKGETAVPEPAESGLPPGERAGRTPGSLPEGFPGREMRARADRQIGEVLAKYRGTENWMKAPNGQPTKLTERQWAQVRTGNFKRWLGFDWERESEAEGLLRALRGEDVFPEGTGKQSGSAHPELSPAVSEVAHLMQEAQSAMSRRDFGRAREIRERAGRTLGRLALLDPETGEPQVFYHGSRADIDAFEVDHPNKKDRGWLGKGIYLINDAFYAGEYANKKRGEAGQNVMPLFVRMKNPYITSVEEKAKLGIDSDKQAEKRTAELMKRGYDGIIAYDFNQPDWMDNKEVVVFSPEQVKSAVGNVGTFSERPDLLYSRAGKKTIRPRRSTVSSPAAGRFSRQAGVDGHRWTGR